MIEYIHNRHLIHRDLKPENFLIGLEGESNKLYCIDFGLSKKFRSSRTLKQYEYKKKNKFTGTLRYASLNALKGYGIYSFYNFLLKSNLEEMI